MYKVLLLYYCLFLSGSSFTNAQSLNKLKEDKKLNVFLDSDKSIINYFKGNFGLINYARDPINAEVHVLFLSHTAANQGKSYRIIFTGYKKFSGLIDTLNITFRKTDSKETKLSELLRVFKIGLVKYFSHTKYLSFISVNYPSDKLENENINYDDWDYWVFNLGTSGSFYSEKLKNNFSFKGKINADRETEESKINFTFYYENELESYEIENEKSRSFKKEMLIKGLFVKSLGSHFSAGIFSESYTSSYKNIKFRYSFEPAIEYNFYPYSESLSKEFSLRYKIGFSKFEYYEKTIYDKISQDLFSHSLRIKYLIQEVWGIASCSIIGSQFLNNLNYNSLELNSDLSLRIFEGFSIDASAEVNLIHDQIYLPIEGANVEEILLNQKKLASQYEVKFNLGFSYTFGSIYNNIINTRF